MFTYRLLKNTDFKKPTFILSIFIFPFSLLLDILWSWAETIIIIAILFEHVNKAKIEREMK